MPIQFNLADLGSLPYTNSVSNSLRALVEKYQLARFFLELEFDFDALQATTVQSQRSEPFVCDLPQRKISFYAANIPNLAKVDGISAQELTKELESEFRREVVGRLVLRTLAPATKKALLLSLAHTQLNPAKDSTWTSLCAKYPYNSDLDRAEEIFCKAVETCPVTPENLTTLTEKNSQFVEKTWKEAVFSRRSFITDAEIKAIAIDLCLKYFSPDASLKTVPDCERDFRQEAAVDDAFGSDILGCLGGGAYPVIHPQCVDGSYQGSILVSDDKCVIQLVPDQGSIGTALKIVVHSMDAFPEGRAPVAVLRESGDTSVMVSYADGKATARPTVIRQKKSLLKFEEDADGPVNLPSPGQVLFGEINCKNSVHFLQRCNAQTLGTSTYVVHLLSDFSRQEQEHLNLCAQDDVFVVLKFDACASSLTNSFMAEFERKGREDLVHEEQVMRTQLTPFHLTAEERNARRKIEVNEETATCDLMKFHQKRMRQEINKYQKQEHEIWQGLHTLALRELRQRAAIESAMQAEVEVAQLDFSTSMWNAHIQKHQAEETKARSKLERIHEGRSRQGIDGFEQILRHAVEVEEMHQSVQKRELEERFRIALEQTQKRKHLQLDAITSSESLQRDGIQSQEKIEAQEVDVESLSNRLDMQDKESKERLAIESAQLEQSQNLHQTGKSLQQERLSKALAQRQAELAARSEGLAMWPRCLTEKKEILEKRQIEQAQEQSLLNEKVMYLRHNEALFERNCASRKLELDEREDRLAIEGEEQSATLEVQTLAHKESTYVMLEMLEHLQSEMLNQEAEVQSKEVKLYEREQILCEREQIFAEQVHRYERAMRRRGDALQVSNRLGQHNLAMVSNRLMQPLRRDGLEVPATSSVHNNVHSALNVTTVDAPAVLFPGVLGNYSGSHLSRAAGTVQQPNASVQPIGLASQSARSTAQRTKSLPRYSGR